MKKANVYLLAYIMFLFICLLAKGALDFPMWTKIVIATTNSSFFFAIADGFQFLADEWEGLYIENKKSICRIQKNIFRLRATKSQNRSESEGQAFDSLEKNVEDISKLNHKVGIDISLLKFTAKLFICAGFLIFLCVLTFTEISEYLFPRQDNVTVCGFLVVLFVQFLRPILQEICQRSSTELEARVDKLVETMNQISEEVPSDAH